MADAPKLNSATDATAARYAPLSWAAVASLAVAVVFVLTLFFLGLNAYSSGQPLFMPLLFALPALGIFLAFLARRHIRNSEGARTGEGYANVGWWACVVVGACYFAYLIANDLSVRTEAEGQLADWASDLGKGNPGDPADPHVWRAFEAALDPGAPMIVNPRDKKRADNPPLPVPAAGLSPQGSVPYSQFRDSPLLLVWARNRDDAKFAPNGLRNWDLSPDGKLGCEVAGTLTCPEGEFPVIVPMTATTNKDKDKKKARVWQVVPGQRFMYVDLSRVTLTRYGWLIAALEKKAFEAADQALLERLTAAQPPAPTPDDFFTRSNGQPWTNDPIARPDGVKISDGRTLLREAWERPDRARLGVPSAPHASLGFPKTTPGLRMPDIAPKFALIDTSDPARVVVKVTVDFLPWRDDFRRTKTFSTGHLVLVCDDPAAIKELAQARQEAKDGKDKPKKQPPPDLLDRPFPFRVVRLESDLMPVLVAEPGPGQGGAGG